MADTHDFWTHGVAVVPQHTPHFTGDENGLWMMPLSWGTVVRQDHGTSNWFHIPLPGATQLDDWPARLSHAWLRYKIGDHAEIDRINVYSTAQSEIARKADPWNRRTDFALRSRREELRLDLRPTDGLVFQGRGPMVMSVHVEFDGDGPADEREVVFAGAGVSYEEKDSAFL